MKAIPLLCAIALGAGGAYSQSLTTTFLDNNGRSVTPPVNLFDITVLRPGGVRIHALDVNSMAGANVPIAIEVYITPTSYVGKENTAAAWIKVSDGKALANARSTPTPVDVGDFTLSPGTYGMGVYYLVGGSAYTNGTGSNQSYSNADLALQLGVSTIGPGFTGGFNTPRVWNGTIYYHAGQATQGVYGDGCKASNQLVPSLAAVANSLPRLGTTLALAVSNLPTAPTPGSMVLGFDKQKLGGALPLPFELTPLNAPGCWILLDPLLSSGIIGLSGTASYQLPIPANPALTGLAVFQQAVFVDPGANGLGLCFVNGAESILGT